MLTELTDPPDLSRATAVDYDDRDLRTEPQTAVVYRIAGAPLDRKAYFGGIERGLRDQSPSLTIELPANTDLKLYGRPGESPTDFAARCDGVADERAATEIAKLRDKYEAKATRIRDEIAAAEDRVDVLQAEAHGKRNDELLSTAGSILGDLLGGRSRSRALRSLGSAAGRRGRTAAAGERVDAAQGKAGRLHDELDEPRGRAHHRDRRDRRQMAGHRRTDIDDLGRARANRRAGHRRRAGLEASRIGAWHPVSRRVRPRSDGVPGTGRLTYPLSFLAPLVSAPGVRHPALSRVRRGATRGARHQAARGFQIQASDIGGYSSPMAVADVHSWRRQVAFPLVRATCQRHAAPPARSRRDDRRGHHRCRDRGCRHGVLRAARDLTVAVLGHRGPPGRFRCHRPQRGAGRRLLRASLVRARRRVRVRACHRRPGRRRRRLRARSSCMHAESGGTVRMERVAGHMGMFSVNHLEVHLLQPGDPPTWRVGDGGDRRRRGCALHRIRSRPSSPSCTPSCRRTKLTPAWDAGPIGTGGFGPHRRRASTARARRAGHARSPRPRGIQIGSVMWITRVWTGSHSLKAVPARRRGPSRRLRARGAVHESNT